ncbi:hypothetical protein CALVIDRAFT_533718 [Calocera viscosa TUFC12733]|uniref:Chromatin target of PRMT1 protein C-terminal domain-containing protein n=1 Tax=Calocera viscosa (strain TUFC12733) TaxID=1330018 RepID=A0A167QLV5_CALVF|nr:hypothetical protein CALVIDRAFT_533718 [Calocera viscosa TUFC12733]
MFDEEAANVILPYDEPTSPVPVEADGSLDGENGASLGDLRLRLAPPTKVYRVEDSAVVKGNLGKLKGVSQGIEVEPEDDDMDLELGYRQNALLLQGEPIAHLPTDQIFAYVTSYAPTPIGLEWVDDTTCVVLFSSSTVARGARRFLLFDSPAEGDPLPEPLELLPAKPVLEEAWPPKARVPEADDIRAALHGQLFVRQAKLNDVKQRDARGKSRFYSTYGTQAGKEGYGPRKRRREEDDEGEVGGEKRRALDEELDAYLADEPSERDRRKKAGLDEQLDAYLVGDEPMNGHGERNGERRVPRPRRERRDPLTREEREARKQQALDSQLDAYVEADDIDTMPSRMRSDWTEEAREREFSPERTGGWDGFGRRRENRYEEAPPVARPMRETERWKRSGEEEVLAEEGERRPRRGRGGRGRRDGRNGDAPEGGRRSNARPRKNQDELDAELEAYLNSSNA